MSNYDNSEITYDNVNTYDSYDEYSDDDTDKRKQIEKIRNFTINDYLSCKYTRNILHKQWEENFENNLERKIENFFFDNYDYMIDTNANVFYRANETHSIDLVSLIKHHLIRDYDLSVFYENPELATPLISQYSHIQDMRKREIRKRHSKAFKESNKEFDWSNMSKKSKK